MSRPLRSLVPVSLPTPSDGAAPSVRPSGAPTPPAGQTAARPVPAPDPDAPLAHPVFQPLALRDERPRAWTPSQQEALDKARAFFAGEGDAFVLDGPAGTGKTTLLDQILDDVPSFRSVHLAAPTARAARVLRQKTGRSASTLHRLLYTVKPLENRPGFRCIAKPNEDTARTLVVVDEASMVAARRPHGEDLFEATRSLLEDLLAYVRSGTGGGQVLFVGDPRQLPPVGETFSAALCTDTLRGAHGLTVGDARLVEVVRQAEGSPVLDAAGRLRDALDTNGPMPTLALPTMHRWNAAVPAFLDWTDGATTPYAAVHLAYANKSAQGFNADVRAALGRTNPLERGDLVTLDADAWVQVTGDDGLYTRTVGRGTAYEVLDVGRDQARQADLTFCTATLRACGEPDAPAVTHRVCLDHLHATGPGLSMEQELALYAHAMGTNPDFRAEPHPKNDEWVGALRLRFAYAMTVHKAQGSEWAHVQVNPWMHSKLAGTPEHLRWLYTAVTRAREVVYLC